MGFCYWWGGGVAQTETKRCSPNPEPPKPHTINPTNPTPAKKSWTRELLQNRLNEALNPPFKPHIPEPETLNLQLNPEDPKP